jgi:hypothetical protein
MDVQLYSDALGLAILQQANRYLLWTPQFAQWLLIAIAVGATAAIVALRFLSNRRRLALGSVAAIGVLVVAWNLTGEIAAAGGSDSISREQAHTLGEPYDWVDQVTHGRPTWYLGQGVADQTGEWMMEFWNHSIDYVGSLDGTIDGPGPTGAPNIAPGGKTYWTGDPSKPGREYEYAVEEWPCVDFAGALVRRHSYRAGGKVGGGRWRLIKLAIPNRFRSMCVGISPDGWTGPLDSGYYRFSSATKGHMEITVSRAKWGGLSDPSPIHVQVGTVRITKEREAALGRVTAQRDSTIDRLQTKTFELPVPGPAFAARVIVDRKFVPHELDPSNPDTRQLGAVVSYRFVAATK